jgi:acyl-CoA reductase-like NAD-dependent aldehyde dehydrogenase
VRRQYVDAVSGKTFDNPSSINGQNICPVAEGDAADIDLAVNAGAFIWLDACALLTGNSRQRARRSAARGAPCRRRRARVSCSVWPI